MLENPPRPKRSFHHGRFALICPTCGLVQWLEWYRLHARKGPFCSRHHQRRSQPVGRTARALIELLRQRPDVRQSEAARLLSVSRQRIFQLLCLYAWRPEPWAEEEESDA